MKDYARILQDDALTLATPERLAELFAELDSGQQARFFNHVDKVASTWDSGGLPMQLQCVTDDKGLTLGGRRVMQMIGEYSHWGLLADLKENVR